MTLESERERLREVDTMTTTQDFNKFFFSAKKKKNTKISI